MRCPYFTSIVVFLKRLHGTSGPCETFGNKCLAHKEEFELKNVEVRLSVSLLSQTHTHTHAPSFLVK